MKLGSVWKFTSDQAIGHGLKDKFHIFLNETDHFRAANPFAFLFISSADYGGCFPIAKANYSGFLKRDSYISCGNLVFYSKAYLDTANPKLVGQLSAQDLRKLRDHLSDHDVMVGWQIKVACTALGAAF